MKNPSLLAFKSGVQDEAPSDGEKDDLYLKGLGYAGGERVDFDETYEEEGGDGEKRTHL